MDITYSNIFLFIKEVLLKLNIIKDNLEYFIIGKSYFVIFNYRNNLRLYKKLKKLNLDCLFKLRYYDDLFEFDFSEIKSKYFFIFIE